MFKTKAEATKEKLFETAIRMIAREGFEATTMRKIAAEAEMAPGAIYYHFASKEAVVQEYYRRSHLDHEAELHDFFAREKGLGARLHHVVTTKIKVAEPYKDMAVALFASAANPKSPLSPFSEESRATRESALRQFTELVDGAEDHIHKDLRPLLPKYLWLYEMGVILFWIYDRSKDSRHTYALIDKTVPLIEQMNDTLNSTLGRFLRKRVITLMKEFEPTL